VSKRVENLGNELQILLQSIALAYKQNVNSNHRLDWLTRVCECDTDLLLRLAHYHGLVPWLAFNMSALPRSHAKKLASFSKQIDKLAQMVRFKSENQCQSAVLIASKLTAANISYISFKGSAALHQFYPEFLQSRASDDLDLLVKTDEVLDTVRVLIGEGYQASDGENIPILKLAKFVAEHSQWYRHHDIPLVSSKPIAHHIDLHWSIADEFSFSASRASLFSNPETVATKFGELYTLPFAKHFVYLCSHGHSDAFFRLRYLADVFVATKQERFDRDDVRKLARECGVEMAVNRSIMLANQLFSPDENSISVDPYTSSIIDRLSGYNGFTPRIHPNKGQWNRSDKNKYLLRQIKNRSSKSHWFSPIVARMKLTLPDLKHWSEGNHIVWFYSKCLLKRLNLRTSGS